MRKPHGFTLVEIAIVLVIAGLLIGGVLRGQELINGSRVSKIISSQTSMQTAFNGFINRYKMLPGDLTPAQALLIDNVTAPAFAASDGNVLLEDSPAFFNNLARSGFISCAACISAAVVIPGVAGAAATYNVPAKLSNANSPANAYTLPLVFYFNTGSTSGSVPVVGSSAAGSISMLGTSLDGTKPLLLTGGGVTASLLAEVDRKSDDGTPGSGQFRYTDIVGIGGVTSATMFVNSTQSSVCFNGAVTPFSWNVNPAGNCQGASIF